jgi:hypothetical protein
MPAPPPTLPEALESVIKFSLRTASRYFIDEGGILVIGKYQSEFRVCRRENVVDGIQRAINDLDILHVPYCSLQLSRYRRRSPIDLSTLHQQMTGRRRPPARAMKVPCRAQADHDECPLSGTHHSVSKMPPANRSIAKALGHASRPPNITGTDTRRPPMPTSDGRSAYCSRRPCRAGRSNAYPPAYAQAGMRGNSGFVDVTFTRAKSCPAAVAAVNSRETQHLYN